MAVFSDSRQPKAVLGFRLSQSGVADVLLQLKQALHHGFCLPASVPGGAGCYLENCRFHWLSQGRVGKMCSSIFEWVQNCCRNVQD